jgi:hypothetical protein
MSPASSPEAPDTSVDLGRELRFAARRRLPQMFKDVAADRATYPTLARVVERIEPQLWVEDPTRALLVVMRRAVQALPKEAAWKCVDRCTWRHVGRLLYFGSEVDPSLQEYNDYLARFEADSGWPKNRLPWPERTRGYLTNRLRGRLADILLSMEQDATMDSSTLIDDIHSGQFNHWKEYIPREGLQEEFGRLLTAGARLIVLVGLPGMGKTWFARHIVRYEDDREVPRVRSFRGKLLTRDVSAILAQFPEVAKDVVANTPEDYLAALLSNPEGPPLLILDNLENADELAGLLPANLNAIVLVTCRHRGVHPPDSCKSIEVGPMLPHEAMAMIMRRIPALSEDSVGRLATTLGGYPLAIGYACSLLEHSDISPQALCDYLTINAKDTATNLLTEEGSTLWAVLRRTVDVIRDDPLAYSLLECITCHGPWPVASRYLLRRYFLKYCAELLEKAGKPDTAMRSADGLYARSVKKLYDFSLITYDPEDPRRVQLNSFVNHILARLVNPRVGEVARRVIQVIGDATEDIYEQFKELDLTGDVGNQLQQLIDQGWEPNRVIENSELLYGAYGVLEFVIAINAHWPGFSEQYPDVVEFAQRFVGTMLPTLALSEQTLGFSVPGLSLNEERLAWISERVPRSTGEYVQRITDLMNEVLRLRMEK